MKIKQGIIIASVVVLTIVAVQNIQSVIFRILFWELQLPLILMFCLTLLSGFFLGTIYAKLRTGKKKKQDLPPTVPPPSKVDK